MADPKKPATKAWRTEKIDGEMSVREAGKKGGDPVRDRCGSGFYEEIGRKGGQATRERHGAEFYEAIGQKGGKVVKEKYGPNFYEQIGHKGDLRSGVKAARLRANVTARSSTKRSAKKAARS